MYMINAHFYEKMADMASVLAMSEDSKKIELLRKFGFHNGMGCQIVNDVADFVPAIDNEGTTEKLPEDAYSDVKHGKLTYPVIYTLHFGTDGERRRLIEVMNKSMKSDESELEELTRMLLSNGSIDFAKEKARQHSRQERKIPKFFEKEKRKYFKGMSVMATTNRFYKALEKYK
jgi:geranylgeranyl pyrophosphate synthase